MIMTNRKIAHSIIDRFSEEQVKAFIDLYSDYKPDHKLNTTSFSMG